MRGYWRNRKATRETLLPDGWLKTGDIAYIDDHSKWFIVDRKKASLAIASKYMSCTDRLDELGTYQSQGQPSGTSRIRRPTARASGDIFCGSYWSSTVCLYPSLRIYIVKVSANSLYSEDDERPRAYVELKHGKPASAEEIAEFVNNKVSRTKRITGGVIFVDSIPKSPSGKILRNLLRDMAKAEARAARL
jgi:4-coumarate--CoA ligase